MFSFLRITPPPVAKKADANDINTLLAQNYYKTGQYQKSYEIYKDLILAKTNNQIGYQNKNISPFCKEIL